MWIENTHDSIEEVFIHDPYEKHNGKEIFKGFYTIEKEIYLDDGQVIDEGFGLDKQASQGLRANIMAVLIEVIPTRQKRSTIDSTNYKKTKKIRPF